MTDAGQLEWGESGADDLAEAGGARGLDLDARLIGLTARLARARGSLE
jgi:hypothetical protein